MEVAGVPEESAFATQRSSQLLRGKAVEPALLTRLPPLCLLLAKLAAQESRGPGACPVESERRLCRHATSRAARADLIEGALAARGIAGVARSIASATHGMGDATAQLMNRKCSGSKNKPKHRSLFTGYDTLSRALSDCEGKFHTAGHGAGSDMLPGGPTRQLEDGEPGEGPWQADGAIWGASGEPLRPLG